MTDLFDAMFNRRSIRRFTSAPVADDDLGRIIEAVRWAPSWANTQCWELVVVKDRERKIRLQEILGRNPAYDAMVDADTVLVLCARLGRAGFKKGEPTTALGDWFMYDLGLANQNLCLAAHALGLGTVIVGNFDHLAVGRELALPEGVMAVTMVPLGHPAKAATAPPRKERSDFVHEEVFSDNA